MGHFWAKLVCHSPWFWGWPRGPGMLRAKNRLRHAKKVGDRPIMVHFNIYGHLGGKWVNQREWGIFEQNRCAIAHSFGGGPGVLACYGSKLIGACQGVAIWMDKRAKQCERDILCQTGELLPSVLGLARGPGVLWAKNEPGRASIFKPNSCAIAHDFGGGHGVRGGWFDLDLRIIIENSLVEWEELGEEGHTGNEWEDRKVGRRKDFLVRRVELANHFIRTNIEPEWMVLCLLPVLPPELRPIIQIDGGKLMSSDINELYRRVIYRNNTLTDLLTTSRSTPGELVMCQEKLVQEGLFQYVWSVSLFWSFGYTNTRNSANGEFSGKIDVLYPMILGVGTGSGRAMGQKLTKELQGPGVLRAKNRLRHAREVGDCPSVVHFNFYGHLGGKWVNRRERGIFEQNRCAIAHSFGGGPEVLACYGSKSIGACQGAHGFGGKTGVQAYCGLKIDRGMPSRLGIVPVWAYKRAKRHEQGVFGLNRYVIAHSFRGRPGVRAYCGLKIDQGMPERLGIITVWSRFHGRTQGSGMLWAKNQLGHAREVGDRPSMGSSMLFAENRPRHARKVDDLPSMVHLIFHGYLGGQMGEMARARCFWAKSVCHKPLFRGSANGPGELWAENRLRHAREFGNRPNVLCLIFSGHLNGQTCETVRAGHFVPNRWVGNHPGMVCLSSRGHFGGKIRKTMRTGHFRAKSVYYSPRLQDGPEVWASYVLKIDWGVPGRLGIVPVWSVKFFVAIWVDKRVKQHE
ncbi:hypothetical protein FXO37_09437 [Capsicum annuum]|nr:hypothetical protein FXO37_09437 [Capsicum annuum]